MVNERTGKEVRQIVVVEGEENSQIKPQVLACQNVKLSDDDKAWQHALAAGVCELICECSL